MESPLRNDNKQYLALSGVSSGKEVSLVAPQNLQTRIYEDVKDGAFGVVLVGGLLLIWLSRTFGKDLKTALSSFVETIDKMEATLEDLCKNQVTTGKLLESLRSGQCDLTHDVEVLTHDVIQGPRMPQSPQSSRSPRSEE